MKLFLDCDGVLADFDGLFRQITGHEGDVHEWELEHGTKSFWKVVDSYKGPKGGFFRSLNPLPDAYELYEAVKHLNPTILTGVPMNPTAAEQKLAWRDEYFPGVEMICCPSKDKYKHMHEGKKNVIVDDFFKYKNIWEENGGTFVLHTSTQESLAELRRLKVIK